jgi:Flp pilus assembly protein TadG
VTRSIASHERGQVLPLFALFLVVLLAFAALAVDVSGAYSARRAYRSTADGAALAGAQDLQQPGSRTVTAADRKRARQHAMTVVTAELGASATSGACTNTDADITDLCVLTGTNFHVTVKAGAASIQCQLCDPARSVQVGIRNAQYPLSFARVLGQSTWNVGIVSVAGLAWAKSYAIQTLKPPEVAGGGLPTVKDITIDGGSIVTVATGDVGSNANMNYSGGGSVMNLTDGYGMYYFDPTNPPFWSGPPSPPAQTVQKLPALMSDPDYVYPAMTGSVGTAPTFTTANKSDCAAGTPACTRADSDAACLTLATSDVPAVYNFMAAQILAPSTIYCYNPGIYDTSGPDQLKVGTGDLAILKPGAYYFKSGLDVSGRLIGGYQNASKGVALMFDERGPGNCSSCVFTGNNALTISLNAGTKYPATASSGAAALPARDWDDQPVVTSGPASPNPAILMTVLVRHDINGPGGTTGCYVPVAPQAALEPATCADNRNQTIGISGNGSIILEGVQYAPSDNSVVGGSSSSNGRVGQIVSWTLKYSGGIRINQQGPGTQGPGTLRLDAACTAPGTPCNP